MTIKGGTDQEITERVLLAGAIAMFPAGIVAWAAAGIWGPLVYLFWVVWPLMTWWLLTRTQIRFSRCRECRSWVPRGATRCRHCTQPLT